MKCSNCNHEFEDGMKFCPNCGSRVEEPQSLKCPKCGAEVAEGINFCHECGSPIGGKQPTKCSKCGMELEEGEKFCCNCGTPVGEISNLQSHDRVNTNVRGTTVRLCWDGGRRKPLWNNPITVYSENAKCGYFFPKDTFEKTFTNVSQNFDIQIEYGIGPFNKTDISLSLEQGHNYTCVFYLNTANGCGYELKDENGKTIQEDGDIGWLQCFLFFFIPLAGFIYYFIKKDFQPISAKAGLMIGFVNLGIALLNLLL